MPNARKLSVGSLFVLVLLVMLTVPSTAPAEVRLADIFGDHMVLQMGHKVPVWGWAAPGESVTVAFADLQAETTAGSDGRWMVELGPFGVGGPYEMVVVGSNAIRLTDVLVGEVWLCSGQSNMGMQVQRCFNAEDDIAASSNPKIRHFRVASHKTAEPQDTLRPPCKWEVATPETVGHWTAAGYYFARDLNAKLDIPIGIINSSWGGTTIEAWISKEGLEGDSKTAEVLDEWPSYSEPGTWLGEMYEKHLQEVKEAKEAGKPEPVYFCQPTVLFNAMISPIIPYAIRGATWYQGESNASRAYQYRALLPALIRDWRSRFGVGDFPFLIVQLAGFGEDGGTWPYLREAQAMALELPKTGLAAATDIGEADDIHPRNKQDVGLRLALAALGVAYLDDIEYSGPVYESMNAEGNRITINFTHTGSGLVAGGDQELGGFIIAGEDQNFVPATARIEGDKVVVWSDQVSAPVAVRYAWNNFPGDANLYNIAVDGIRLPAVSFRTDDWPQKTE